MNMPGRCNSCLFWCRSGSQTFPYIGTCHLPVPSWMRRDNEEFTTRENDGCLFHQPGDFEDFDG